MLGGALVNFHLGLSHFRLNHKGKSRSWLLNREPSETSAFHQRFPWGTEKWQTRLCSLGSSHRCGLLGAGLLRWLRSARQVEEQMMLRKILPLAFLHNPCQPVCPPRPSCYQGNTALILAERTLPSSAFQETATSHPHVHCGLTVPLFPTGPFPEPSNTTKKPPHFSVPKDKLSLLRCHSPPNHSTVTLPANSVPLSLGQFLCLSWSFMTLTCLKYTGWLFCGMSFRMGLCNASSCLRSGFTFLPVTPFLVYHIRGCMMSTRAVNDVLMPISRLRWFWQVSPLCAYCFPFIINEYLVGICRGAGSPHTSVHRFWYPLMTLDRNDDYRGCFPNGGFLFPRF